MSTRGKPAGRRAACRSDAVNAFQVQERLRSDSWEGRTAAGECLGLIAAHCQHNTVADAQAAAALPADAISLLPDTTEAKAVAGLLSLGGFSVDRVLQHGTQLLASGGSVRHIASLWHN